MSEILEKIKTAGRIVLARTVGLTASTQSRGEPNSTTRILYVANAYIPTLQLSFVKPLASLVDAGDMATELLTEQQMKELFGKRLRDPKVHDWINQRYEQFQPTIVIFCRYSGPHAAYLLEKARSIGASTIFHIDDDLLNVPVEIGIKKYEFHNHPTRLEAVNYLLEHVDLVYCSTESLKQRLMSYCRHTRFYAGPIYCSGEIIVPAVNRPARKIGYMGFDHAHDFELVLPAIIKVLRRYPNIEFELFGSIPKPSGLDEFGARVNVVPPEPQYDKFMEKFASLGWDIGICPLAPTSFNAVKANTKWIEYSSIGAAVIASVDTIYDECCAQGCGLLAETEDEWLDMIDELITNDNKKFQLVVNSQFRIAHEYSVDALREQILEVFREASFCKTLL